MAKKIYTRDTNGANAEMDKAAGINSNAQPKKVKVTSSKPHNYLDDWKAEKAAKDAAAKEKRMSVDISKIKW